MVLRNEKKKTSDSNVHDKKRFGAALLLLMSRHPRGLRPDWCLDRMFSRVLEPPKSNNLLTNTS